MNILKSLWMMPAVALWMPMGAVAVEQAAITEQDIEYSPEVAEVHVGQPIHLVNKDPFEHKSRVTLQQAGGTLGEVALKDHLDKPGEDYVFKIDRPGTYEIRCMLHDGMTATIHVVR